MITKKYNYFLFDWDGSIVKTLDIWHDALKTALEKRDHFLPANEIGANFEVLEARLKQRGYTDTASILTEAGLLSEARARVVEFYPNSLRVLTALKNAGKTIALVTTSLHGQIDPLIHANGMDKLFHAIICGDDVEHIKSDPEPILKAMDILMGDPDKTVMIGDSDADLISAASAGIDSILFYPSGHEKFHDLRVLKQLKPTRVISNLAELL